MEGRRCAYTWLSRGKRSVVKNARPKKGEKEECVATRGGWGKAVLRGGRQDDAAANPKAFTRPDASMPSDGDLHSERERGARERVRQKIARHRGETDPLAASLASSIPLILMSSLSSPSPSSPLDTPPRRSPFSFTRGHTPPRPPAPALASFSLLVSVYSAVRANRSWWNA